jgi:hypothetical protein
LLSSCSSERAPSSPEISALISSLSRILRLQGTPSILGLSRFQCLPGTPSILFSSSWLEHPLSLRRNHQPKYISILFILFLQHSAPPARALPYLFLFPRLCARAPLFPAFC